MDWIALATLVIGFATAVFTGWAVWQRSHYNPKPLWVATMDLRNRGGIAQGKVTVTVNLRNAGNGTAHDVSFYIGRVGLQDRLEEKRATVLPGEGRDYSFTYEVLEATDEGFDEQTGTYPKSEVVRFDASSNSVTVTWREPPVMKRVIPKKFELGSLQPAESKPV
jgi:hypothetical protein